MIAEQAFSLKVLVEAKHKLAHRIADIGNKKKNFCSLKCTVN